MNPMISLAALLAMFAFNTWRAGVWVERRSWGNATTSALTAILFAGLSAAQWMMT